MDREGFIVQEAERRMTRSNTWLPLAATDPALEQSERAVDQLAERGLAAVRGADPHLDAALDGLRKVRDGVLQAAATLDDMAEKVQRGELDKNTVPRHRTAYREEAGRQLRAAQAKVNDEIRAARERLVQQLLPELPPDGGKTREWKDDLDRAVKAADGEPVDRFTATWRRFLATGHREPLRLLAGSWGRDLYRSMGGSADTWTALREALVAEMVSAPGYADNPLVRKLSRLRSKAVREAADGTAEQVAITMRRLEHAGEL